jgi:hypothetical protein
MNSIHGAYDLSRRCFDEVVVPFTLPMAVTVGAPPTLSRSRKAHDSKK